MHASLVRASAVRPNAAAAKQQQKQQQRSIAVAAKAQSSSSSNKPSGSASASAALIASLAAGLPASAGDLMNFDPANTAAAYAAATSGAAKGAAGAAATAAGIAGDASSGVVDALSSVNPLFVAGGAAALAVPAALAALLGGGGAKGKARPVPVEAVLESLVEEGAVLVDVRSKESAKQFGSPSLPKGSKRVVSLPFTAKTKAAKKGETASYQIDQDFAAKFSRLGLTEGGSGVILLDSFGKESPAAAAALAAARATPEAGIAYVADGAEGPRGWKASGASWRNPSKGLGLDLSALKNVGGAVDALAEDFRAAPTAAKAGLAVGALVAGAALLFQEAETVLEIAGLLAAGQFAAKRLVFASDRKRTADELRELVDSKIGVSEAGADLRRVADALLEDPVAAAGGAIKAVAESGPSSSSPSSRSAPASTSKPAAAPTAPAAPAAAAAAAPATEADAAAAAAGGEGAAEAREWIEKWRSEQQAKA